MLLAIKKVLIVPTIKTMNTKAFVCFVNVFILEVIFNVTKTFPLLLRV